MTMPIVKEVLRNAQEWGVKITLSNGNLKWVSSRLPPPDLLDSLRAHKAQIVELLERKPNAWVLKLKLDDYSVTAINMTAPSLIEAIRAERARWGDRLLEVSPAQPH